MTKCKALERHDVDLAIASAPSDSRALIQDGLNTLRLVAARRGIEVSSAAAAALTAQLREFMEDPARRIFENHETHALDDYRRGVAAVSDLACDLAAKAYRRSVERRDIEEAVKISYCHQWPFCRRRRDTD